MRTAGLIYVQYRGGLTGLLRQIAGDRIGFVDCRGNRQYLPAANLAADGHVSLFLMDYPNRRRLNLIGHAQAGGDTGDIATLMESGYVAEPERVSLI